MSAKLIDGKAVAERLHQNLAKAVHERTSKGLRAPGLAVVLVGENPASQVYVGSKRKKCKEAGFKSFEYNLPAETLQTDLLQLIDQLNDNPEVDDHLVIWGEQGTLFIAAASPDGYQELTSLKVLEKSSLTPASYSEGRILVRTHEQMAAVDILAADGFARSAPSIPPLTANSNFGKLIAGLQNAADPKAMVDDYFAHVSSYPLIEDKGLVHFVYRGEAEDVTLMAGHLSRMGQAMHHAEGTDLFYYSSRLEPGTRIAYDEPPRPGLEHHLVLLDGALTIAVGGQTHELGPGDCLRYQLFGSSVFATPEHSGARYLIFIL